MALGKVEQYLREEIKKHGTICLPLIDSENSTDVAAIARKVEEKGASAILVGGSSASDQLELGRVLAEIKSKVKIPVILFPGNVTGVSPKADAILFSSLLNSENPYFITGAQALGAIAVKKYGIEPLPTAYIIVGEGTAAWFVGRARGIPFHKPNLAVMYSLAAQFMGMRFVYLEAGSGASQNVPPEMVTPVTRAPLVLNVQDCERLLTFARVNVDSLRLKLEWAGSRRYIRQSSAQVGPSKERNSRDRYKRAKYHDSHRWPAVTTYLSVTRSCG